MYGSHAFHLQALSTRCTSCPVTTCEHYNFQQYNLATKVIFFYAEHGSNGTVPQNFEPTAIYFLLTSQPQTIIRFGASPLFVLSWLLAWCCHVVSYSPLPSFLAKKVRSLCQILAFGWSPSMTYPNRPCCLSLCFTCISGAHRVQSICTFRQHHTIIPSQRKSQTLSRTTPQCTHSHAATSQTCPQCLAKDCVGAIQKKHAYHTLRSLPQWNR